MKRGLLDTNILSYYLRGVPAVVERAREYLSFFGALEFSIVSYYEVLRGLEHIGASQKNSRLRGFGGAQCSLDTGQAVSEDGSPNMC